MISPIPLLVMPKAKNLAANAPEPAGAPDQRRLPLLLRRAWYGLNQAFRRRIAHLGITPDQFTVLRTLLENDGITQRKLTELISSDPNTVASLIVRMEQARLVQRQIHREDRRAHRLRLKPAGRRKFEQARAIAVALQTEVLGALPKKARANFLKNMTAIAESCWAAAENSLPDDSRHRKRASQKP
jgi:DNA-binding MarR family transcriptional regulator